MLSGLLVAAQGHSSDRRPGNVTSGKVLPVVFINNQAMVSYDDVEKYHKAIIESWKTANAESKSEVNKDVDGILESYMTEIKHASSKVATDELKLLYYGLIMNMLKELFKHVSEQDLVIKHADIAFLIRLYEKVIYFDRGADTIFDCQNKVRNRLFINDVRMSFETIDLCAYIIAKRMHRTADQVLKNDAELLLRAVLDHNYKHKYIGENEEVVLHAIDSLKKHKVLLGFIYLEKGRKLLWDALGQSYIGYYTSLVNDVIFSRNSYDFNAEEKFITNEILNDDAHKMVNSGRQKQLANLYINQAKNLFWDAAGGDRSRYVIYLGTKLAQ